MIEKCPECNGKIDVLLTQEPNPSTTSTMGTATMTYNLDSVTYPATCKTYKCSNLKCWVTKIEESWQ